MITSMSKLERDVNCDGSLVFPRSPRSSFFAGHGNVVHDFLMRVPRVGRQLALEQVADDRHRSALEELSLEGLPLDPAAYAQEVAIAYDTATDTARELCRGQGRPNYAAFGITPTEAVGTIDVLGLTPEAVLVIDYKTGWADLGPVKSNWQLRGCALLAARLHHREKAVVAIIRIKPAGEEHYVDQAELSTMDLDLVQQTLIDVKIRKERFAAMDAAGETVPTNQGRWCTYCPSFEFCPSKMNLIAAGLSLAPGVPLPQRTHYFPAVLSPTTAPVAYERMELLRGALKRYEEQFAEYAAEHPVELPGGYVYGRRELSQESVNVDRGAEILKRWLGEEAGSVIEVKRSVSKEAAKRVLAKRFGGLRDPLTGKRVTSKALMDAFMESLREAGALNVRTTYPVMRYRRAADSEEEHVEPDGIIT